MLYSYKQEYKIFESKQRADFRMNYLLAMPEDIKEGERLPMIVSLHGAGERGWDAPLLKLNGVPKYLDEGLPVRAIVLAPQVPSWELIWNTIVHELMELVVLIRDSYPVDEDRVSVTGLSMGGYGTWELAMSYTGAFSALAPFCGGGTSFRAWRLKDLPIRACHGDADDTVPLSATMEMIDAIRAAGGEPECIIRHGVGHDCWHWVYEQTNLIEWLVAQKRNTKPVEKTSY